MAASGPPIDGGTVLITGASSGIGLELARELAPRAGSLVAVARRMERLEDLKDGREELMISSYGGWSDGSPTLWSALSPKGRMSQRTKGSFFATT